MHRASVDPPWDSEAWRNAARAALRARIAPHEIDWDDGGQSGLLISPDILDAPPTRTTPRVPSALIAIADAVVCHREPQRFALLYRLLWRLVEGEPLLLERATDPDTHRALMLHKAVNRDTHKMKAFVRFRRIAQGEESYVAWFEPENFIVDRVAPFFMRRFAGMKWTILTPYRSVRWDLHELLFGAGAQRSELPADDSREELWRTYYANIFNPARVNPSMMQQEMPRRYWKHLPEAQLIPALLAASAGRVEEMTERQAQAPRRRIPERAPAPALPETIDDLDGLRARLAQCRACELWQPATQAVAGSGPRSARTMLIGEQPGDSEDLTGRPFVGPAGKLLDRALAELGIDRDSLYLTNAVKHFRFEQRGKVRLHKNPLIRHVSACAAWLQHEMQLVRPDRIVCLGATAARAVFGPAFRLQDDRGRWQTVGNGVEAMATLHPAAILRQGDAIARASAYAGFVADLRALVPPDSPLR
jgi:uracil-DNA glycosylase